MIDPSSEYESEKYFLISKKELNGFIFTEENMIIRVYISQEFKKWKDFSLRIIKFIKDDSINELKSKNLCIYNTKNFKYELILENKQLIILLNDKEEMNQKYIEITKNTNSSNLNLNCII